MLFHYGQKQNGHFLKKRVVQELYLRPVTSCTSCLVFAYTEGTVILFSDKMS